ncbi:MAG TPA: radical SAM protein, partial [Elusimicrobiales bacterium]|nr:radical SAM protein [Elusimicrobiales bacterium]
DLAELMKELLGLPGEFRLRFSSLEPGEVSRRLAGVLKAGGDRFCGYFHLPLQSGSDEVLRAMGRPYGTAAYLGKLRLLREYFEDPGLYADVIAGYPTETDAQFERTLAFIRECRLAGLHVFRFSARPGTRAALLKPLPRRTVDDRAAALRGLDSGLRAAYAASMTGRVLSVLTLRVRDGAALGLAPNFLQVSFKGGGRPGSIAAVRVNGVIPGRGGCVCAGEAL